MGRQNLVRLRYDLLKNGHNLEYFHATEDKQLIRKAVFSEIAILDDLEIDAIIAQKNKTNPSLYTEVTPWKNKKSDEKFYELMIRTLLGYIFQRYATTTDIDTIVVVVGALFTGAKRDLILKNVKNFLKTKVGKPFHIYFHQVKADINCQLADYCGWAIYVSYEKNESRPIQIISKKIKSKFDIFSTGTTTYY